MPYAILTVLMLVDVPKLYGNCINHYTDSDPIIIWTLSLKFLASKQRLRLSKFIRLSHYDSNILFLDFLEQHAALSASRVRFLES